MKKVTGLYTELHTFTLKQKEQYEKAKKRLESKGTITEIFANNGYAFEFKKFHKIM